MDCTQHKSVCSQFGVNGYPTLKRFGAEKGEPEEYEGDRSVASLKEFATGVKAEKKAEAPKEDDFYAGTGELGVAAEGSIGASASCPELPFTCSLH